VADFKERGRSDWTAGDDEDIPTWGNGREERADRLSKPAFLVIACNCFSYGSPGSHGNTDGVKFVWEDDQHDKRVGI
jgi:hypothetical protein